MEEEQAGDLWATETLRLNQPESFSIARRYLHSKSVYESADEANGSVFFYIDDAQLVSQLMETSPLLK